MNDFFPFIHQIKKKKQEEFQSLYLEIEAPSLEQQEIKEEQSQENSHIIEIQL